MPHIFYTFNNTVENKVYRDESELPRNVKVFMKEIRREFPDDELKLDKYLEKIVLDDDPSSPIGNWYELDLRMDIDAERYAKGDYSHIKEADTKFDDIADSLGIDRFHIFTTYINKKEFGEKFLKDLKKYMKSTGEGESIHSIRFDLTTKYEMEIKIILKKEDWGRRVEFSIKNLAKDYLASKGYKNVRVYIP
jgi:hypothetical protein